MNLFCVGLSHRIADVDVLGRFARSAADNSILRGCGCAEALLLTTCNRVEVYAAAEKSLETDEITRCLERKIDNNANVPVFYRYEDAECAQHLFRVAAGLDSMVVGETEILGQTKKAYESARKSGAAGPYLHR
jgi:glutamyl-tRNA reductase